jgi:hypothetical protein
MAVVIVAGAVSPGPIGGDPLPRTPQNPLGMESAGQALDLAKGVGFLVTPTVALVALVALALRFRRARGAERQQHKWFAYGTLLLLAGLAALFLPLSEGVSKVIVAAGLGCFTAALAVAVLRHGLYEIDVIINRPGCHRGEGKQAGQADPAMTPCIPCSFGLLPHPRSGSWSPAQRSSRVTVTARCIPLVTAVLWHAGGTAGENDEARM